MNYATVLAQNVDKSDVDGLEAAVVAPMENEQRIIGTSDFEEPAQHLTVKQKAYAAGRRIENYFSEMPEKRNEENNKGYNAVILPLMALAAVDCPVAGLVAGIVLGAYALYKTRCPAVAML